MESKKEQSSEKTHENLVVVKYFDKSTTVTGEIKSHIFTFKGDKISFIKKDPLNCPFDAVRVIKETEKTVETLVVNQQDIISIFYKQQK